MDEMVLTSGKCLWDFCLSGQAALIRGDSFLHPTVYEGKILVVHSPSPDIVMYMKTARAIVAETGGVLCHAAVLALEMGLPIVVACENALNLIKEGDNITIEAKEGIGVVYAEKRV